MLLNNFSLNDTPIYFAQQEFNTAPEFFLLIFDREQKTTTKQKLTVPESINATSPFLLNIIWANNSIYGLLGEDVDIKSSPMHVVKINPSDFTLTDLNIQLPTKTYTSMVMIENNLYTTTWGEGLFKIDLTNKEVTKLLFNGERVGGSRLAVIDNSHLAMMKSISGNLNGALPFELNLSNTTFIPNGTLEFFALVDVMGNGFYDSATDEFINIFSGNSQNIFSGLIKTNFRTNTESFKEIEGLQTSNRNLIVLNKVPL